MNIRDHVFRLSLLSASLFGFGGLLSAGNALAQQTDQPTVLCEMFRNTSCTNCMVKEQAFETWLQSHPGVELLYYHNNTPYPNDYFYLASKEGVDVRDGSNFYNVQADPVCFVNGQSAGSNTQSWELATGSKLSSGAAPIVITATQDANKVITFHFTATGQGSTPVKAFVALKESQIYYDNSGSYGKPPGNLWNNVFRMMLPSPSGTEQFTGSKTFDVTYDPTAHSTWNLQNMKAIVFAQDVNNNSGYPIASLGTYSLAAFSGVQDPTTGSATSLSFVGGTAETQFRLTLDHAANVRLVITDMLGRDISAPFSGAMAGGVSSIELPQGSLAAGAYIARLFVDGLETAHVKFISQ